MGRLRAVISQGSLLHVVAIFREVFFEGIVHRTLQQFGYLSQEIIIGW